MNFKLSKKYKNRIIFFITIMFVVNFNKSIKALDYSYIGLFDRSPITELDSSFIFITNSYNDFIFTNKIFTADKIKFSKNRIALIETDGTVVDVEIGDLNYKADIKINNLDTQNNVFRDTAFLILKNNKIYTATITVSEFEFKNSKIGSLIIDDNKTIDGNGINIFAKNSLDISNNIFLNAFIVATPKGSGDSTPKQDAIKQNITIYGENTTNITDNSVCSGLKTTKKFTLGKTNTSTTILSGNKTYIAYSGGYFIHGNEGISILGKTIKIENNLINENNSGGFFKSETGDIEIGDNNTHILIVNDNKTADTNASFAKSNNGNITLKSPTINGRITLDFKDKKWKNILSATKGKILIESNDTRLSGYYDRNINDSNFENFINADNIELTFGLFTANNIMLKDGYNTFFEFTNNISLLGKHDDWSNISLYYLKANKNNDSTGAIFKTENGNITAKMNQFTSADISAPSVWMFRQENKNGQDEIKINKVYIKDINNDIAGFYYSKGKSFKMHATLSENEPMVFDYRANINGIAVIKIGSEESDASTIQYEDNAFFINISDFSIWLNKISSSTKAGILFTNPQYISTDSSGKVVETNKGNLRILISSNALDLNTRSLNFDFDRPSIAVVANKQNYGDGKNKKIFEFGETLIEGNNSGGPKRVRLNGYTTLQTGTDNDFSGNFVSIKPGKNTVGNSKLIIGDNISEFDTASTRSNFVLHNFEMKTGKIRVYLENSNHDRNLFEWAGNYKTLYNGSTSMNNEENKGTIKFGNNVTMDIDGDYPEGEFTLVQPGNFNIDILGRINQTDPELLKNLSITFFGNDDDIVLEKKEIVHADIDNGFVIKISQIKDEELSIRINQILRKYNVSNEDINSIYNNIDYYQPYLAETNYKKFLREFYNLLKEVLKGYEIDEDTSSVELRSFRRFTKNKQKVNNNNLNPVLEVLNNLQQPDENFGNSGSIGTVGLSSIKTANIIISDRISNNNNLAANSKLILLADNDVGSKSLSKKIKNSIDIFTKFNFGFGKLKTTDGDRRIFNFGALIGADFNILEDNLRTGISIMYDYNKLNGDHRKSNIYSFVLSFYSKYDIFKFKNFDTFYVYSIINYALSNEKGEYGFILNFDNNNNNATSNTISLDVMTGYRFDKLGLIPEIGLGFIYGIQNSYKDNLGQEIKLRSSNIMLIKSNIKYEIPSKLLFDDISIGLKIGLSYNILQGGDKGFNVVTPNNFEYYVHDVDGMDRLSLDGGFNISYNFNLNSKLSFYYDILYSKNFINNKFLLEYRYSIR